VIRPELAMPKTFDFIESKFNGEDLEFRQQQIIRGLKKGRDKFMELTERYYMRAPIILLILTNRENAPSFLRVVLAVLHDIMRSEEDYLTMILFDDFDSDKWGRFKYDDAEQRPADQAKWYAILSPQSNNLRDYWLQIRLDSPHLVPELQKMSNCKTVSFESLNDSEAPLLGFRRSYPVLYEALHAYVGMMPSNSRLCEQQHGSKRSRSNRNIGLDQQDGQQAYISFHSYMMREERRNSAGSIIDDEELPPAKRFKKARDHNKTLDQVVMMGQQMKSLATQFV
jgi:hypothetical protein